MTDDLKDLLEDLAAKYEVASFSDSDPVQFLNWSENRAEAEIIALFSAMLAFGNRKIFIPKIKFVLEMAEKKGGFYAWIKNSQFENDFKSPNGNNLSKFYRFYSYEDVLSFFRELSLVLKDYGTLENAVRSVFVEIKRERLGNDLKKDKRLYGEKYDFRRFSDALFASEALGSFFQLCSL